jgi:hypothetical protein
MKGFQLEVYSGRGERSPDSIYNSKVHQIMGSERFLPQISVVMMKIEHFLYAQIGTAVLHTSNPADSLHRG